MILKALERFIFATTCLHCGEGVEPAAYLCSPCNELLTLIEEKKSCSCFDSIGPARSLLKYYERYQNEPLLELFVSFFIVQMNKKDLFDTDYIVPISDKCSKLLANALCQKLQIPLAQKNTCFTDKTVLIVGSFIEYEDLWEATQLSLLWGFPKKIDRLSLL